MKTPVVSALVCGRILAALTFFPVLGIAANVTWDGDTDANADGLWESGVNWSTNAIPATTDNVQLLNVTSGSREVTISSGSPQTINKLTITQTTAGASTVLNLNDNLTISLSGNNTPFALTATAGAESIITNIADGKTLLATNSSNAMTGVAFNSTLNLGTGSIFRVEALGSASDLIGTTFGGPITATGTGAGIVLQAGRFVQNPVFSGAMTVSNPGSTLTIRALNGLGATAGIGGSLTFNGNDSSGNSVNIGTGTELIFNVIGSTYNFTNRVNVAASAEEVAGGKLTIGALPAGNSTMITNFNGGLLLGAGARSDIFFATLTVNLGGASSFGTGATLMMKTDNAQATWNLTNSGVFTMDGAAMVFDWAASSGNNASNIPVGRRFLNKSTGIWTLRNSSSVSFISTTGLQTSGGYGLGANNENAGTMNVESGSSVGFLDLFNSGTLNLGSSTGGVSDSEVKVGSPSDTFTNVNLVNGLTSTGVAGVATINIKGDTYLGRTTTSNVATTLNNGTNVAGSFTSTGSIINVGDGSVAAKFTVANTTVNINNATGNSLNINSGGTLLLKSVQTTTGSGSVSLANSGTLRHAGTLQFQGNSTNTGVTTVFSNSGTSTYQVSGQNAKIELLAGNGSGSAVQAVAFTSSGLITGSSAYDKLTYTNSSGNVGLAMLGLTMSGGAITAGNGTNGAGASSIGTLEFVNTNITLTGATKLSFDIGGLGNAEAPVDGGSNPILSFDRIVLGASKTFALGTGAVLDIWMTNGFGTQTAQTYTLIDTGFGGQGSITGSFATLLFQGQAVTDQYTVDVSGGQVRITLAAGLGTPIPEPSTYALLAAMTAGVAVAVRRRRRNA